MGGACWTTGKKVQVSACTGFIVVVVVVVVFVLIWKAQSFSILHIQDEANPVECD